MGRLVEQKNHEMLLKSFNLLLNNYKINTDLVIIGEGNLRNKIIALSKKLNIHEKVHLLNNKDNILNIINKCKVFVQTSLWEGQPNVLIEALLLKKK